MPEHFHDDDDAIDECVVAIERVYAFLHGELPEVDADAIRHHLHACERCMESFEIESTIHAMISRACKVKAPAELSIRIRRIRIDRS